MGAEWRRSFDSTVLLTTWSLWKERNRRTFNGACMTLLQLFHLILEEADADAWVTVGFASLAALATVRAV